MRPRRKTAAVLPLAMCAHTYVVHAFPNLSLADSEHECFFFDPRSRERNTKEGCRRRSHGCVALRRPAMGKNGKASQLATGGRRSDELFGRGCCLRDHPPPPRSPPDPTLASHILKEAVAAAAQIPVGTESRNY